MTLVCSKTRYVATGAGHGGCAKYLGLSDPAALPPGEVAGDDE